MRLRRRVQDDAQGTASDVISAFDSLAEEGALSKPPKARANRTRSLRDLAPPLHPESAKLVKSDLLPATRAETADESRPEQPPARTAARPGEETKAPESEPHDSDLLNASQIRLVMRKGSLSVHDAHETAAKPPESAEQAESREPLERRKADSRAASGSSSAKESRKPKRIRRTKDIVKARDGLHSKETAKERPKEAAKV